MAGGSISNTSSGWFDIPAEILGCILSRLPHPGDRIRFGAVCRSWRSALMGQPPTPCTWMVLTPDACRKTCSFFSLSDNSLFTLSLPDAAGGARFCGSFGGWLVVAHRDHGHLLLNLFSRAKIPLPRRTTIGTQNGFDIISQSFTANCPNGPGVIRKAILSSPPSSDSDQDQTPPVLVALHDSPFLDSDQTVPVLDALCASFHLSICRPRGRAWTSYPKGPGLSIDDIIFYQGLLYAVCYNGQVYIAEVGSEQITSVKRLEIQNNWSPTKLKFCYLVECSGRLLMVHRYWKFGDPDNKDYSRSTTGFKIFEDQPGPPPRCWVEVKSLGGHALFLGGTSCSKSVPATQCRGGLKEDCIYFTRDQSCIDSGRFSMLDGSITPLLHTTPASRLQGCKSSNSPPQWLHFTGA